TFELGMALAILALLVVFGLGAVAVGDVAIAGLAGLLAALTYLYAYFTQIWSGWPLQMSTLMLIGLWALALEYADRPAWRTTLAGGLLAGGIVVTHGSELISATIILATVLIARFGRLRSGSLPRDLAL